MLGLIFAFAVVLPAAERPIDSSYSQQTAYSVSDAGLDRLQDFFRPTMEASKTEFPGQTGFIRGFRAGAAYLQGIWLRDAASHIPATRYFYPLDYLTTWIEEHLAYQGDDGRLYDWIAPGEAELYMRHGAPRAHEVYNSKDPRTGKPVIVSADKNTMMSDQEASAVDAAWQVLRITGRREWLRKPIRGKTILERLDLGLAYVLKRKLDPTYGLVTSGYTASFGDVSPVYLDQRVIYLDENSEKTPVVVSAYTNAVVAHALEQLEDIHRQLADKSGVERWTTAAASLRSNINKHLWQEDKGFYRMHLVLKPELVRGWPQTSNMFDMAGNAMAVLFRVAGDRQAQRIFDVAQERRREFGMTTISGLLLPPFPKGFFHHGCCTEQYSYLNGGEWDWLAGRLLLAEFERGYATRARQQLSEIAQQSVADNGLFEWYTREGKGKGSAQYVGNVGALGGAILGGLLGIDLSLDALNVTVRLGEQAGKIHLYQPVTDTYVAYQYGYNAPAGTIEMRYQSNFPRAGKLMVLVPRNRATKEVLLDGRTTAFRRAEVGEDGYVVLVTDWKPHRLELRLK